MNDGYKGCDIGLVCVELDDESYIELEEGMKFSTIEKDVNNLAFYDKPDIDQKEVIILGYPIEI